MTHQQGENQPGQGQPGQVPHPPQPGQPAPQQQAAPQGHGQQTHNPQYQPYPPNAQGQQYAQHQQHAQQGSAGSAASAHDPGASYPRPGAGGSGGNFLADVFRPSFAEKATVKHVRWYYLIVVVVVLVGWVGKTLRDFMEGATEHAGFLMGGGGYAGPFAETSYNPWPGLYTLFVGGAIAVSLIILARMFFENTIANSKISERAGANDS